MKSFVGLTAAFLLAAGSVGLAQQQITVEVNGSPLTFDQPPVEQAGRVFVPLRGVFERLGASVVYANGIINATGNGRNVSLRIGSTQATVNGQTQYLDQAPFEIGARTLVPLRFVAQALGASVNWQQQSNTVVIQSGGGSNYNPPPPSASGFDLVNRRPSESANTEYPGIHAEFNQPVNRDSIHVSIDGQDVTSRVYANASGFDVTPGFALAPGTHRVMVTGTTQSGAQFQRAWSFTTTSGSSANYINGLRPTAGGTVPSSFEIAGRTLPGSRVHIVATARAEALGGLIAIGTDTFQTDTTADANGVFRTSIAINSVQGSRMRVVIQSTSPSGSSVEQSVIYNVQ